MADNEPPIVDEDDDKATSRSAHRSMNNASSHAGMESSVLKFTNVNFIVGKKGKESYILRDVTGSVKWGRT